MKDLFSTGKTGHDRKNRKKAMFIHLKGEAVAGNQHIFVKGRMVKSVKPRPLEPDKVMKKHPTSTTPSEDTTPIVGCNV